MPDGNLFTLLHNPKTEIDFMSSICMMKEACSGMSHLHVLLYFKRNVQAENILHLDLAARNLLVKTELITSSNSAKYTIKISDFGMSSSIIGDNSQVYDVSNRNKFPVRQVKFFCNLCRWCAPEVATSRCVSRASDVWSFGVVMWEVTFHQ